MEAWVLLGSFFVLILIGTPVAYAMGIAALIGAWWIEIPLDAVMIAIANGVNKFSLLAIPFFVLAGAIMAEGGMARRLVAFANVLVGFIRGGPSLVNILASTFFGAISGSAMADPASVGRPAVSTLSFQLIGTPSRGPHRKPAFARAAAAIASARLRFGMTRA